MVVLQLAFQPHRVEVHVTDVFQLGLLPLRRRAQEHVEGVARAADEDVLAVDPKQAVPFGVDLGGHLADAKPDVAGVGDLAVDFQLQVQGMEILFAHLRRPPQAGVGQLQLRELLRCETDDAGLVGTQPDGLRECDPLDLAPQHAFHRLAGRVLQLGLDGELGGIRRGQVEARDDAGKPQGHRAAGVEVNLAPQAHALVGRQRVPVHERDGEVVRAGREDLDGQRVGLAGLGGGGHVEFEQPPGARHFLGRSDLAAVHPDVSAEVDAVKTQPHGLAAMVGGQLEVGAVPPRVAERALRRHRDIREIRCDGVGRAGDGPQVHAEVGIRIDPVLHQGAQQGGGQRGPVPAPRLERRARQNCAAFAYIRRRLDGPILPQQHSGSGAALPRGGYCNHRDNKQNNRANSKANHC